ncbi:MAG: carbohydrate kinase, partial [Chitinivibrionales bacterium]|nr:carbohydrate kinase [Chitinivibrionales bacterium]
MTVKKDILGLGEILWDLLPGGRKLGGAVANLIYFTNLLGHEGRVASAVGDDDLGKEILSVLEKNGLSADLIQTDPDHPTGTVEVTLDNSGRPSYSIHENVAWDNVKETGQLMDAARNADALVFGSLFQRSGVSRNTLKRIVSVAKD